MLHVFTIQVVLISLQNQLEVGNVLIVASQMDQNTNRVHVVSVGIRAYQKKRRKMVKAFFSQLERVCSVLFSSSKYKNQQILWNQVKSHSSDLWFVETSKPTETSKPLFSFGTGQPSTTPTNLPFKFVAPKLDDEENKVISTSFDRNLLISMPR